MKGSKGRPFPTGLQQREIARKGGFVSAKKRAEKRTYSEIARVLLPERPGIEGINYVKKKFPYIDTKNINIKMMMVFGIAGRAMAGDVLAFNKMQELAPDISENNTEKAETAGNSNFSYCCEVCSYPPPYPKQIEMAEFIYSPANEPRLLLGARRYGKSEYAVIVKTAQEIALNNTRILLIVKAKERAKDFGLEILRCLKELGIKEFKRESSTVIHLAANETKEPNLSVLALGSRDIRSRHPDIVIMDDPVIPNSSPADRLQAKRVYDEILKLTQRVRIIGQPVCKNDLYDVTRKKINTLEMPYGSIPDLDTDLDILRLAGVDEASISASYFLKVGDISATPFSEVEISPNIAFNTNIGAIGSIDPSHEGGDYTAITIAQGYFERLLIVGFCFKAAWYDCKDKLIELIKKYKVCRCYFENNALGQEPIRQLKNFNLDCEIRGFKSLDNKEAKIQNAGMFSYLFIVSKESNADYIEQLVNYEVGAAHDDAPDSLANLLINMGYMKSAKEKRIFNADSK